MDQLDVLLSVAEIAVGFAGFAALASLIGRGRSGDAPEVDAVRLRNMLTLSLTVVALSFVPRVTLGVASSEQAGWIVASGLAAVWLAVAWWRIAKRTRPVRNAPGYDRMGSAVVIVLGAAGETGFVVTLLGLPGALSDEVYLAALLSHLTAAGLLFARVIASVLTRVGDRPGI